MDSLSRVAGFIGLVQLVALLNANRKAYYSIRQATKEVERSLLVRNYGSLVAAFFIVVSPETATQYEQIDAKILHGEEQETLAFRQAITDESNMTAIAVSPPLAFIYPTSLLIADGRALSLRRWQSQH